MVSETVVLSAAAPFVKSFVEKTVTPKLQAFLTNCGKKVKETMTPASEHFQEYLERSYNKYIIVNTLVFHNSQRNLKEIYVEQTLVKENHIDKDKEITKIVGLPDKLIKKYQRILITDTAGMGKSTIMKRMFVDLIEKGLNIVGIPIYVELNKLSKSHRILDEIQNELNSLSKDIDKKLYLKLFQTGGFVFFLDGYDEITVVDRVEVTRDIQNLVSKAGKNNYFVLTSRPESGLDSFGDFQSFTIQPLKRKEAYELLRKYDLDEKKELSNNLIELLRSGQYKSIDEYLENPLLVSLLFTAYDYNRSIPFEKHRFYKTVFEAYFEKHDNTKVIKPREKRSNLKYDGFDTILRFVGYKCLTGLGVKFPEDSIIKVIREAREWNSNLTFSESDFLNDLVTSVPLFCKDGAYFKWVHKSLMEYFAARFIFCDSRQEQDKILSAIYNSEHFEKYYNMLDLYCDIDPKGFSKHFTLPFCEEFVQFHDNTIKDIGVNNELVEERVSYLSNAEWKLIRLNRFDPDAPKLSKKYSDSSFVLRTPSSGDSDAREDYLYYLYRSAKKDNYVILAHILSVKIPSLFRSEFQPSYRPKSIGDIANYVIDKLFKGSDKSMIIDIDINLGKECEELYFYISELIYSQYVCKNYDVCKKEIDRIEKEIQLSKSSPLLAGI